MNCTTSKFNCIILAQYDAIEKDKSAFSCVSQYFKTRYQTIFFHNKSI